MDLRSVAGTALTLVAALALGGGAGGIHAQTGPESLRRAVEALQDSARVRVTTPRMTVEGGRFLGIEANALRLLDVDAVRTIRLDQVRTLAVQERPWLRVGLQSAGVGIVAGFLIGYMHGAWECGNQPQGCDAKAIDYATAWSLGLGSLGGILGGLVGSRLVRWKPVYP